MEHFAGMILARLRRTMSEREEAEGERITISNHQQNAMYGVHQALLTLEGDPNNYRLILAPADAPILIGDRLIGDHFAKPLGDR